MISETMGLFLQSPALLGMTLGWGEGIPTKTESKEAFITHVRLLILGWGGKDERETGGICRGKGSLKKGLLLKYCSPETQS